MRQGLPFAFSLLALTALSSVHASSTLLNSGMWKFDIHYDLIGLPQTFPGYSIEQCVIDNAPYPKIDRPGNECQAELQGQFGNTYTWILNCSDSWEMVQGLGRIHYNNDKANGDVHLQILNPQNPPQIMEFSFKGVRTGDCET